MSSEQVQSLKRAICLLEYMEARDGPLTLSELSAGTSLPKSTVHRLLTTMMEADIVEQSNEDGRYRLGLRLLELGFSAGNMRNVVAIAKPHMQRISFETNESVCLALLNRGEVLILAFNESSSAFHVVSRVGAKLPAHCTVQGKIMLAYLPPAEVKRILRERGMRAYTPNTMRTYEQLEQELKQIRRRGYAEENSEFHVGLHSVAAPIYDVTGHVSYSFAIVSMFHPIGSPEFTKARELALEAARDISHALGYRGQ